MIRAAFSHFHRRFLALSTRAQLSTSSAVAVRTRVFNGARIAAAAALLGCACAAALVQQQRPPIEAASRARDVLHKHFVADAAAEAAPAVVNILSLVKSRFSVGASSGSGFIISDDGYIVTNAHVVDHSDTQVLVTFEDGRRVTGRVHSIDRQSDIALVKIEHDKPLPIVKIGTSASLRPGEFVVALGSPLHLQNTVTFGIVSTVARHGSEIGVPQGRNDYIQTDASINVGNSGGPLVNLDGEVIGINTMKAQGTDGISFAIPIDTAWQVVKQLLAHGRVIRPYIGMKMVNVMVEQEDAARKKRSTIEDLMSEESQVMLVEIERNSPAEKAGLKRGDLLVEIDGKPVKSTRDVLETIGMEAGQKIRLKVLRERNRDPVTVVIVTEPEDRAYQ